MLAESIGRSLGEVKKRLRTTINDEITKFAELLREQLGKDEKALKAGLRAEFKAAIDGLRAEMLKSEMASLERLADRIDQLGARINRSFDKLERAHGIDDQEEPVAMAPLPN